MTTRKSRREDRESHAPEPTPPSKEAPGLRTLWEEARDAHEAVTKLSRNFDAGTDEHRSCMAAAHHLEAILRKTQS